jgi:hypothetical protein
VLVSLVLDVEQSTSPGLKKRLNGRNLVKPIVKPIEVYVLYLVKPIEAYAVYSWY